MRLQERTDFLGLRFGLEDEGHGFQPDNVADPRLPENFSRPGGHGLLLMKSAMNHVEFNELGNQVVMRLPMHAA